MAALLWALYEEMSNRTNVMASQRKKLFITTQPATIVIGKT